MNSEHNHIDENAYSEMEENETITELARRDKQSVMEYNSFFAIAEKELRKQVNAKK